MNIKFPVSWLRDYLKTDLAAKTIASYLTASGPSVERIEKNGEDYTFDVEVTTNRPDSFSVFGIAREANAILKSNCEKSALVNPEGQNISLDPDKKEKLPLDVKIQNQKLCPRFTAIILEVKIGEPPALIRNRLTASGIRPINNIVDITNYIMLETGQPMHAFDYDKIQGAKMTLRASREGEKITTLDGSKHLLPTGSIVIEDAKRIVDLCGIMGGENSQITSRTKRTIFFVQSYDPVSIRKTTQSLAFRTDAAARFEKGVDLENILPVLARSVFLAKKNASAKIVSELIDIYPQKQKQPKARLAISKLNKYLGIEIESSKAQKILENLGFKVTLSANQIEATAPSWRSSDISQDVDMIEEIARIYGYHNLPSTLPSGQPPQRTDGVLKNAIDIKKVLKDLGFTEVITYSIISKNMLKTSGVSEAKAVELANPLTEEWQFMRPTVIPSLLDIISKNAKLKEEINIFEIANTYLKQKSNLPKHDLYLTAASSNKDFYQMKGLCENIFTTIKRKPTFSKLRQDHPLFEKEQSAQIKIGETEVGIVGLLKTPITNQFEINNYVLAIELNLTTIYGQPSRSNQYHPIPKFPPIKEDISAIFSIYTPVADIISQVKNASDLVKKIEILDIYQDPKLGENKKSVALSLTYQKTTSTPTQDEVNVEREKIIKSLELNLRAKLRK